MGPYYNEPSAILSLFDPESGHYNSKKTGWKDEDSKKYKELLEKAKVTTDQQELANIYLEAEKLLVGTGVIMPQYLAENNTYVNEKVSGYHVSTSGSVIGLIIIKE